MPKDTERGDYSHEGMWERVHLAVPPQAFILGGGSETTWLF